MVEGNAEGRGKKRVEWRRAAVGFGEGNKLFYMGVCRERGTLQSWRWRGMNFGSRVLGGV